MSGTEPAAPEAVVHARGGWSLIWLIPIIAGGVAIWLGVQTLATRGPLVTLTFQTGSGVTAGQTQVKHKAVTLGTVEDVRLSHDMSHVVMHIRMTREANSVLTDHAHFWVVRPRLTLGSVSGLETLVSGAFIEVDPGPSGGKPQLSFTGLEEPPTVRSDEPGRAFALRADRIGSLGPGSPVFFRDVIVGEVSGYDLGNGEGPAIVNVFVRAPYDRFVHPDSHFWNTSGLTVQLGAQGVRVELESLQAVIAGGVAFETAREAENTKPADNGATFRLFDSHADAEAAGFRQRIQFVSYFTSSVSGLANGSKVQMFGIQIGDVTDIRLLLDLKTGTAKVRVQMEVQPERVFGPDQFDKNEDPVHVTGEMVAHGMRAQLVSSSLLTGQQAVSFQFVPSAPSAQVSVEDKAIVVPSQPGGLDGLTGAATDIANKLSHLPLDQIGDNLNHLLAALDKTVGGPELKQAIQSLTATMGDLRDLARNADAGIAPTLKRLPEIATSLQGAITRADKVLGSVGAGYGQDSDFQRNLERLMGQLNDTARSIRLLADFLDRHPEALIRGRPGEAAN